MNEATLNLVVLRAPDLEAAHTFYSALGLIFEKHQHGAGPIHYSSTRSPTLEIYAQRAPDDSTTNVRLGFKVTDCAQTIAALQKHGALIISEPKSSPWGLRAVVQDPFGHKIELIQH